MTTPKKEIFDWQRIDTACLDISLHNKYQVGNYLESLFIWTSKRFSSCLISLGDTLHRHNLLYKYQDPIIAYRIARELGDEWIAQAQAHLHALTIPFNIIRSDNWLTDPRFLPTHDLLWNFYEHDESFRNAIKQDIDGFVARSGNTPEEVIRKASLSYLMEETAADIVLAQERQTTHIYSGGWHNCYYNLMERSVEIPAGLKGLEMSAFKRISPARLSRAANTNKKQSDSDLAEVA